MNITNSKNTGGLIQDSLYLTDPTNKHVGFNWEHTTQELTLDDTNIDYTALPVNLGTTFVKKVFITYNGIERKSGQLLETVVASSNNGPGVSGEPNHNNSNQWTYKRTDLTPRALSEDIVSPLDFIAHNFYVGLGTTLSRDFIDYATGTTSTHYYRAPFIATNQYSNVESMQVYLDGWYTSYIFVTKTYNTVNPSVTGIVEGTILYNESDENYYKNLTGNTLPLDPLMTHLPENDNVNWGFPDFNDWREFGRLHINNTTPNINSSLFMLETQHLALPELYTSILNETLKFGDCCHRPDYDQNKLQMYMKLHQKRYAAFLQFEDGDYYKMQQIIQTAREMCSMCLYHDDACNNISTCGTC